MARICGELGAGWTAVDVDTDPELRAEYGDRVPVIVIDGREHGFWRVEEDRFRAALALERADELRPTARRPGGALAALDGRPDTTAVSARPHHMTR